MGAIFRYPKSAAVPVFSMGGFLTTTFATMQDEVVHVFSLFLGAYQIAVVKIAILNGGPLKEIA